MSLSELLAAAGKKLEAVETMSDERIRRIAEDVFREMLATRERLDEENYSLSVKEIAQVVGCSEDTVYKYVKAGVLNEQHFLRVGRDYRFRRNATIRAWQAHTRAVERETRDGEQERIEEMVVPPEKRGENVRVLDSYRRASA
jgi:excisionase family DNA binding protein